MTKIKVTLEVELVGKCHPDRIREMVDQLWEDAATYVSPDQQMEAKRAHASWEDLS